ncbi:SecD/SecF fusion protein [Belliella buryatensis]|uniref:Multifunctional fusion protein n=1 Tax=Belliella buryatensis TaxID=1500549 RepID=A0A239BLV9_9BACT|nr:protein translocase subunit SecDF [Belliella buryatensis]SNS08338.1 SecD/SecF fusion protein [Belliella buryatensis]
MRNQGVIVFLTVIVTALCLYYLSFTFVSNNIQQKAVEYATDEVGNVDFGKKQAYLDSIYREPVYNFLGAKFTYKEIKETELGLGLDLQGGMHVTLEVSPIEIVKGLSGNSKDPMFNAALEDATQAAKTSNQKFVDLFYAAWQSKAGGKNLNTIFATAANRGRISLESSDADILGIIDTEIENAIERSFNILRTRVDRFGTSQPNIQRIQGSGRIQIEVPGVDNQERVRNLLQGVAKLQFWEVAEVNDYLGELEAINALLVSEAKAKKGETTPADADTTEEEEESTDLERQLADGEGDDFSSEVSPIFALTKANYGLVYEIRDTVTINRIFAREDIRSLLPRDVKFLWSVKPQKVDNMELLELYGIKLTRNSDQALLEGDVVTDARQTLDQTSRPAVSMQMNADGARKWRKVTGENIGKRIAVVLDDYVYTAPTVQGEIPSGQSEITGNFSLEEAKDLANILKSGSLPAPTKIVEEAFVGPTLGKEASNQGVISMIAGLVLVVLFMVAYYSKGGFVAIAALVFNIFFILGILAQLGAALTLPGIAGIVLTIGMSIDANVLIFERIKEELRNGSGLLAAINEGYGKAFSAILDSNVTTFLTGAILYALGQGPVKGFAIVLMIGIASSFFSAVFITRVIVYWMSKKKGDKASISFSSPLAKNVLSELNIDFLSKRKVAYLFSTGIIIIGLGVAAINGLKFGVDFTGGRSYIVQFTQPIATSDLKVGLDGEFDGSVEVKTFGANNVLKVTTSYLITEDDDTSNAEVEQKVKEGIASVTGLEFTRDAENMKEGQFAITGTSKVGATVADDIKTSSAEAMFFALVAIFLYILLRFRKWQFSLGSIIALVHDVFFVIAAFAIASALGATFEIDQVFIAAVLTVVGYSINDTVIVFDRIRENIENRGTSKLVKMFNDAINQTMARTLITSFTTLIVVLVLLIFGGEVLRGFSFALLIGVLVGTYSSIYIATPIVVDLMKREIESESTETAKKPA